MLYFVFHALLIAALAIGLYAVADAIKNAK
jgi:hypothetical protein